LKLLERVFCTWIFQSTKGRFLLLSMTMIGISAAVQGPLPCIENKQRMKRLINQLVPCPAVF